jgi:uncharacterized protein (DUF2267 family)
VVEAGTLAASKEREHSMKGDQFIAEVRNLADLASTEEAEKATRATLEILRERIAGNEPSNLAAQLPPEVASYVEASGSGESFSVEAFYDRVAQREGVGRDDAVRAACGSRGGARGVAFRTMRAAETTILRSDKPVSSLVQDGPFRYTCNPLYLSDPMIYGGIAILRNSLWAIFFLPLGYS